MKLFFKPAIKILNCLSYSKKFILIGTIFIIPLGVVMFFFISEINYKIQFAQKERQGVEYISQAANFLQHTIQYAVPFSLSFQNEASFEERLRNLKEQINNDIQMLDILNSRLGTILAIGQDWKELKSQWQEFKGNPQDMGALEMQNIYHAIHIGALALIIKAGETSNLILDPDLDSYYLMDTIVNKLPMAVDQLDELRVKGIRLVTQEKIESENEKLLLTSLYGRLEATLMLTQRGLKAAFNYNPALVSQLEKDDQECLGIVISFLKTLDAMLINTESIMISPADYYAGFTKAIDTAFALQREVSARLDGLLQKRIDRFKLHRGFVEWLALVMLLGVVYFTIAFYLSVKNTVSKLDAVAKNLSQDRPILEITLENKDELGEITKSFNKIGMKLRESYMRLEAINEELEEDIVQKRQAEEEIIKLNKELEQRVIERTADLDKANEALKRDIVRRQQIEQRLGVQYAVTRLLAGAASLNQAAPKILQIVCEALGWDTGEIWIIDPNAQVLKNMIIWHVPAIEITEFEEVTHEITFPVGVGMPGRIWMSNAPAWIEDVSEDKSFLRADIALKLDLHGAFGFPIRIDNEVKGTLGFFSRHLRPPDDALLAMFDSIGDQIGHLIKRTQAEEGLRQLNQNLELCIQQRTVELEISYKNLHEANELSKLLLRTIPFGMDIVDEEGNILFLSESFLEYFGKDALGRKCWTLYKDNQQQCADCPLKNSLGLGETGVVEVGGVMGGRIFQISHTGMIYKNKKAVLEIFEDITERRRAEQKVGLFSAIAIAIAEAQDMDSAFKIVLDGVGKATGWLYGEMWVPSVGRVYLECNSTCYMRNENLMKFREASIGVRFLPGIGLPGRAWALKKLVLIRDISEDTNFSRPQAALAAGLKRGIAIPIVAGEEVVSVMTFFTSEINEAPDIEQILSAVALQLGSVLRRKQVEEELKKAYNELKQAQSQLVQSAKMASVGQLAGGVAHEINNPLTGVLNNVQLIKMELAERGNIPVESFKQILDVIEESALRCAKITRSLLDFSHAAKESFQPLSVNEMVGKVVILISHEMKLQNIVIIQELESDIPQVYGDSQLLQQVIFDMISNSRWAMYEKSSAQECLITIKTAYEPAKNKVCMFISDNGIGIPEENLPRIFDPFFTTKPVGEGTGLGLAIVYGIVKQHKGDIEVKSRVGEGATFKISLPALRENQG